MDSICSHHMAKDASVYYSLHKAKELNIFDVDDYALAIVGGSSGDFDNGVISDVYHVPQLSANSLFVPQITQTSKKVEFWPNNFVLKDITTILLLLLWLLLTQRRNCISSVAFRI